MHVLGQIKALPTNLLCPGSYVYLKLTCVALSCLTSPCHGCQHWFSGWRHL